MHGALERVRPGSRERARRVDRDDALRSVRPYVTVASPAATSPAGSPPGAGNEAPSGAPSHRTRKAPDDVASTTAHAGGICWRPPMPHSAVIAAADCSEDPPPRTTAISTVPI